MIEMMRRWVLLILVAMLAGCSGDAKTKSIANSEGSEKLPAGNPPVVEVASRRQASPDRLGR